MELVLGKRKVQVIGGSFLVNLPRPWVITHGLKQGDPVLIELQPDDSLKISCVSLSPSRSEEATSRDSIFAQRLCSECFKPIEAALDREARRHFSEDMLCQCGRGS
jgi:phosphate uptake regulator